MAAKLGDWSWDASTDVVTFSERAAQIFQIPPGPHMTWTAMRDLLHPADAERARVAVEHAIQTHTDYDIEYRLINGTGERWISARGRGVYGADAAVVGMLGVVQDITEQVRTRERSRSGRSYARVKSVIAPSSKIAPKASGGSSSALRSTRRCPSRSRSHWPTPMADLPSAMW